MDRLRCMVVDDEPLAVSMLENYLTKTSFLELVGSFNDPVAALDAIREVKPQLVYLDIQMPELSGLELSRLLPKDCLVIFTTAFKEYALESYDVSAVGYLLKPIRYQKFVETSQRALELTNLREAASSGSNSSGAGVSNASESKHESIFIKVDGIMRRVNISDILYISGMKDYVSIQLASQHQPLVTHITMKAAQDMLPSSSFMRVHKSYIVALSRIEQVTSGMDIVVAGKLIHVGEQYTPSFKAWLESCSFGK